MDINKISIGEKVPEIVNAVIEIPRGSQNKYEFDKKLGVFKLDRVLYSPTHYPTDYGFIPETFSEDGDPLDILVLGGNPVFSGCLVRARPIGLLKMVDDGDRDYKILGVQADNPRFDNLSDIEDLKTANEHFMKEIAHFARIYKELEGKKVSVIGWENAEKAKEEIEKARKAYKNKKKTK